MALTASKVSWREGLGVRNFGMYGCGGLAKYLLMGVEGWQNIY